MFIDLFKKRGKENQFSYDGLKTLYDFLIYEEYWREEPYVLNVTELCCDFSETTIKRLKKITTQTLLKKKNQKQNNSYTSRQACR